MSFKYLLAAAILLLWFILTLGIEWDNKHSFLGNLIISVVTFIAIGAFYWAPFWLIFMK